jgi:hypothetical protein
VWPVACRADPLTFTAFALLNAVGYHTENSVRYGDVRRKLRLRLGRTGSHWRSVLAGEGLLEEIHKGAGARLSDVALALGGPPSFEPVRDLPAYLVHWQAESVRSLASLPAILAEFWERERLDALWADVLPEYERACRALDRVSDVVAGLAQAIDGGAFRIELRPNLLDAFGRGYSVSTAEMTVITLGGEVRDPSLARHELLHRWADVSGHAVARTAPFDPMPSLVARYPRVAQGYPDLGIWLGEVLVRSACAVLEDASRDRVVQLEEQGFLGSSLACDRLAASAPSAWNEAFTQAGTVVLANAVSRFADERGEPDEE